MAYEPSNDATLLTRRVKGIGGDAVSVREYYYEPSDRTVHFIDFEGEGDLNYDLPVTTVIDRWCENPGVAPFREVQVYRLGNGITLKTQDNVLACVITCTLAVTLTASQVVDSRGELVAVATGAHGDVLFSLDNFDTPGIAPSVDKNGNLRYVWENMRPGTYTVYARETRPGGCRAQASATLVVTYGPRYRHGFRDADNVRCVALIYQRDYTGPVENLIGQPGAVAIDWPGSATDHVFSSLLLGSECQLALYITYVSQLLPLYSGDERLHRVEYSRAGKLFWKGYLLPEQYDVAFKTPPATFNLSATDGLGTLSTTPFVGPAGELLRGDWTVLAIVLHCLGKLDLDLPLHVLWKLYPEGGTLGTPAIEQAKLDVSQYQDEKGKAWNCGKVLTEILSSFQARLFQQEGIWRLERLADLSLEALTYAVYSPAGVRGTDVARSLLRTIEHPSHNRLRFVTGNQRQGLRPAVSTVTVKAEPGDKANHLRFALPKNADLPAAFPTSWSGYSTTPTVAYSQLIYQGKGKTPTLRLIGSTANRTTPERAPWVQTPETKALPLPTGYLPGHLSEGFYFSFKVKPYGVTPSTTLAGRSIMTVALHFGNAWLAPNTAAKQEDQVNPILFGLEIPDDKEIEVRFNGFGSVQHGPQLAYVRFYAPVGGATPVTVDLTDIALEYDSSDPEVENYTDEYTGDTRQLVSRVDDGLTLFHSDTPGVRRAGSLLDVDGIPTEAWFEAANPSQLRELGDYVVRDRALLQRIPAQVLTGLLRGGPLLGPGLLLTDPNEARPAVYLLTSARHDANLAEWQFTAVQDALLLLPGEELPENAIYNEDESAWQAQDGFIEVYENA